jgi:hypothetical protein
MARPSWSFRLLVAALSSAVLAGCGMTRSQDSANDGVAASLSELPEAWIAPEPARQAELLKQERYACEDRLSEVLKTPELPGAPDLESRRAHVLLYAKAEPVLFVRQPEPDKNQQAASYRSTLRRSSSPWSVLKRLWAPFSLRPDLGQSVLLREGYLYADKPELAFALVDLVSAQLLFSDRRIWIQRGEHLFHAERSRTGHYVWSDGPELGQRVRLRLFDRLGTGPVPPPLHRDFRGLSRRLGFDRVKLLHLGEQTLVAELRYGSIWVPTVIEAHGARLELDCELIPDDAYAQVAAFRARHEKRERALEPLRRAILEQVDEGLPFDEPITEYGQQDGKLRPHWLRAYEAGKHSYEFTGDVYYVFNARGRPLVPQVCVDFIFDTFERASGTWWRPRGEPRQRVMGKLDFATLSDETRRRATSFIELASRRPDAFEVWTVPERERVPFKYGQELSKYLTESADRFQPGDVVMIRGYAPWDKRTRVMHFHSFFVFDSDPLTGMPLTLAGNPGRPVLQTWQFEAFRTPERSIWYRVRPRLEWLEHAVATAEPRASK